MNYQLPLASALAEQGFEPSWFAYSGQEGTPGAFDYDSVLRDLSIVVNYLRTTKPNGSLSVIAHCVSGLFALEQFAQHPDDQALIKSMIIYGLLFNPSRRWRHALPKLKKSGVNIGFRKEDTDYDPLPALSVIHIPLLFCHAKDKLNLRRATEQELATVVETAPSAEVAWFDKGYDRDLDILPLFVERYSSWLRTPR
jgi:predicted alpha/beta hydrolase